MPEHWSRTEVEAIVADYVAMLASELQGLPYNKAEHNRFLQTQLNQRSSQSIEFKHANISAILITLGFPFISGYKPRSNYQQLLREVVEQHLAGSSELIHLAEVDADRPPAIPTFDDILAALTDPPRSDRVAETARTPAYLTGRAVKVDFFERESRNRALGRAGELFVLEFERARLVAAGHDRLAANIEHVADTRGDGLGYDVLSFDTSGVERLLEVKTTKYGAEAPFVVSRNELGASQAFTDKYSLYRVFDFRRKPRLFTLAGALTQTCLLDPCSYEARVL